MMSICCPSCGSLRVVARNHGRKVGGAIGAVGGTASGAAGAMAGAKSGALIGAFAGPVGITLGSLAGAILAAWPVELLEAWPALRWVKSLILTYSTTMNVITAVLLLHKMSVEFILPINETLLRINT